MFAPCLFCLLLASLPATILARPTRTGWSHSTISQSTAIATTSTTPGTTQSTALQSTDTVTSSIVASSTRSAAPQTTSAGSQPTTNVTGNIIMAGWYPAWLGASYPPDQISWSKYNSMAFSFGIPTADPSVITLDADSQALLPTFVSAAKKNNVKAFLSLGGWSGSQYFSPCMATDSSRTAFVNAIVGLVQQYSLDGIDFDWEYPGKQGNTANQVSLDDSANFLAMLQQLKATDVGSNLKISAAVTLTPFVGADGQPMSDVSEFAKVIDFIEIMAYDIWGSWSAGVGPNAPLYDKCATKQAGSVETAVDNWASANFPKNQIVVGVPSYGRGFSVPSSESNDIGKFPTFDVSQTPAGDEDTSSTPSSANSGLFDFSALVTQGYLTATGEAASGVTYDFDDCSQTPFIYKQSTNVMISYDDARSFASKGSYIKDQSLGGFAMWHVLGDSNDILLDSIHNAVQ
ncbi:glycoside hydrolase family 18 protein [Hypholoma sublateritium FD-334 SS-4]|uniref:Glycoside hydrolase family 18 protein n=1 Tax=Hypholoma sublateritium (strain FD-334 SS-4) TaxID=945553 RepID=A0A0D2M6H2_HYPSF|nr:glycoside hydrolase family 18 protein [Hypholoma sublateritium FD-334 SS-4]